MMDLADILDQAIEQAIRDLDGPILATIESYDAASQRVDCKPVVPLVYRGLVLPAPTLQGVPVMAPISALGGLTIPLQSGDTVQLVVQGWEIDQWLASGQAPQEPTTKRRFSLSDLVAIPALRRAGLSSTEYSATSPVLSGNPVLLGDSTATDFVALASLVLTQLQNIQLTLTDVIAKYNGHMHKNSSGTPFSSAPSETEAEKMSVPYSADSVSATKVKAK